MCTIRWHALNIDSDIECFSMNMHFRTWDMSEDMRRSISPQLHSYSEKWRGMFSAADPFGDAFELSAKPP